MPISPVVLTARIRSRSPVPLHAPIGASAAASISPGFPSSCTEPSGSIEYQVVRFIATMRSPCSVSTRPIVSTPIARSDVVGAPNEPPW